MNYAATWCNDNVLTWKNKHKIKNIIRITENIYYFFEKWLILLGYPVNDKLLYLSPFFP